MNPQRIAQMPRFAISFDWETALIQPGNVSPPPVLASASEPDPEANEKAYYAHLERCTQCNYDKACMACESGHVDLMPEHHSCNCARGSGEGARLRANRKNIALASKLLDKPSGRAVFRAILDDDRYTICVANGPFDFFVSAVDAAAETGEDLMPKIFAMYDPEGTIVRGFCNGRVFDVQNAENLHAIAQGHLGKQWRDQNKVVGKTGRMSLDAAVYEVTGREDAKANDRFRLNYANFDGVPLDQLPYEAWKYPQDDSNNTLNAALSQAGHMPSTWPHSWQPDGAGGYSCAACRIPNTPSAPTDCIRLQPRRNLHDLSRQVYAHWALHLGASWGFHVPQDYVDHLEEKILAKRALEAGPFIEAGIIRADGTENQAVLKRLVAIAYGARNACDVCATTADKKGKPLPGKVISPKTGNTFINCEACDGTALHLPREVPRSEGGGIAKGRDTLQESGDELLMSYAEQEGKKILTTYIPLMRGGRACNVCGEKGVKTKYTDAHKPWCSAQKGEAGYRPIPLILRPNPLVETGRCSYSDGVHGLPRKGGVREGFRARLGYLLSSTDYVAGELVTHAQNCLEMVGYSKLADAINNDLDAHLALAATILGISYEEAKKRKGEPLLKDNRQGGKAANFGFPGGMAEMTFVIRKRSDPDLFTPCANGPDENDKGVRGYKGLRPCILLGGMDRCGIVKVTSYNDKDCPPVCLKCLENAKQLREFWFAQWPENNPKDGYFSIIKKMVKIVGPSGTAEIVHPGSWRIRGGVQFTDGANGLFQGRLSDAAKNAFCQIQRECYDRTWIVRSSEMMTSAYAGGQSPLWMSRAIELAHDESICEHPESVASDAGLRVGEIMVESLRFACPQMQKGAKAEPALMHYLAKAAEPVWKRGGEKRADANDTLIPWVDAKKAA